MVGNDGATLNHTGLVSVCAVVVTYNRKQVLPHALEALKRQTHPVTEIIVVDNRSTDGTGELIQSLFPEVTYVGLDENVGYGAGLAFGLESGIARNHDYFWMLDDDSAPDSRALDRCLAVAASHADFGIVGLDGGIWRRGPRHFRSLRRLPGPCLEHGERECDFVLVDGALISRETVLRAGFPRKDFFMMVEDLDYSRRIKRTGLRIFVLDDGLIQRGHLGSSGPGGAPWRGYYQTRNHLAMVLAEGSVPELAWWAQRQARFIGGTLLHGSQRGLRIRLRLLGAWHGFIGRMGRTIEPSSVKQIT